MQLGDSPMSTAGQASLLHARVGCRIGIAAQPAQSERACCIANYHSAALIVFEWRQKHSREDPSQTLAVTFMVR